MTSRDRTAFWICAAVLALALWGSGAATPVYPVYAREWSVTPFLNTAVFAVYPLTLVIVLVLFGDLSDRIGRRATIRLGLLASIVGVLLFAVAPGVVWLLVGRAFMGIGVGFCLGPATAKMIDIVGPSGAARAGSISTAAAAVGMVMATFVGGALVEYAPWPLHLTYVVLLVAELVVLVLVWRLPDDAPAERSRWRPRGIKVARGLVLVVAAAGACVAASYAVGALLLSLGTTIAIDLVGSRNAFVTGTLLGIAMVVIGVVALAARRIRVVASAILSVVATVLALAAIIVASLVQSLPAFLVFCIFAGVAYSLLFSVGVSLIGRHAPASERAGTLAVVYLVAYSVQGAIALWLGAQATLGGLQSAIDLGAPVIAALAVLSLVLVVLVVRRAEHAHDG